MTVVAALAVVTALDVVTALAVVVSATFLEVVDVDGTGFGPTEVVGTFTVEVCAEFCPVIEEIPGFGC